MSSTDIFVLLGDYTILPIYQIHLLAKDPGHVGSFGQSAYPYSNKHIIHKFRQILVTF